MSIQQEDAYQVLKAVLHSVFQRNESLGPPVITVDASTLPGTQVQESCWAEVGGQFCVSDLEVGSVVAAMAQQRSSEVAMHLLLNQLETKR